MSPRATRWAWLGVALVSGVVVGLGFPPYHVWPAIPVGLAGVALACRQVRPGRGLAAGYLFGVGFYGVVIHWMSALGWPVLLVLTAWMAVWYALVGLVLALTRRWRGGWLAGVAVWLGVEWAGARWPIGGFGWARLAYATPGTPIAGLLPLVSSSGVGLLIVATGFGLGAAAERWWQWRQHRAIDPTSRRFPLAWPAVLAGLLLVSGLGGWAGSFYQPAPDGPSLTVAVIQGNVPGRGIDALGPRYTVENNHLSETILAQARINAGQDSRPDFVVWPENSTATDPLTDQTTHAIVQAAVDLVGVPILVGAITDGPGPDERQTTGLWWTSTGVTAVYHKRNLVPFGEWIPARQFFVPLVPALAYVGAQSIPGTDPGVLDVSAAGQPLRVGDIICFELAYDDTFDQMIAGTASTGGGAQVAVVQTSNAMFTGTVQMSQQEAITRVRAMESRREVLVATTNSLAGLIDAQGRIVYHAQLATADAQVFTVPIRTALTPAVAYRPVFDAATIAAPLLVWLVLGLAGRPRRRPTATATSTKERP